MCLSGFTPGASRYSGRGPTPADVRIRVDRAVHRDVWHRFSRLRRQRRVQTAVTLGLVFLGPVLAVATFLALGPFNQDAASPPCG
jgi:hypothetical protein